jgi:protein-S-isoprenylcysteine O-methyltransferase Ste14
MNSDTSRKGSFLPFLVLQLVAVLILVYLIVRVLPGPWNLAHSLGLALILIGAVLLFTARFQLGNSFAVSAQARELVTSGIYSRIRNPIYIFSGLMVLGFVIVLQKPYLFLLLVILIAAQTMRARRESEVLEAKFGERYREYRKQTWF